LISLGKFAELSNRESGFDSRRSGLFSTEPSLQLGVELFEQTSFSEP
jgi:hypothetical protein